MMKKVLSMILAASTVLLTVACGQTQSQPEAVSAPEATVEEAVTETSKDPMELTPEDFIPKDSEKDDTYVVGGIDFKAHYSYGKDIMQIIDEQADYDTLKANCCSNYGKDEAVETVLSDGDSLEYDKEKGIYVIYYYAPKTVTSVEELGGRPESYAESFHDQHDYNTKVVAGQTYKRTSGENLPIGITVTYEDGTEESITLYVTTK